MMSSPPTEQFGIHIMIDGYNASPQRLADTDRLVSLLNSVPKRLGMTCISVPLVVEVGPQNRKDPGGLSGFVMIAESHISFHTFPSRGFVTIDLYTCQPQLDHHEVVRLMEDEFGFSESDVFVQERGLRYPTVDLAVAN